MLKGMCIFHLNNLHLFFINIHVNQFGSQLPYWRRPRWNIPARNRSVPGNSGDFVEAAFRPEVFRSFSDNFWPVPAGILLPCTSDFLCFCAGSGGRNLRPGDEYIEWRTKTDFFFSLKIHCCHCFLSNMSISKGQLHY